MKRPEKIKFNISKPPTGLQFTESLWIARSIYSEKIQEALKLDSCIEIVKEDKYLLTQIKMAAKKLKIKLVFGSQDGKIYIKPIQQTEHQGKLLLLLRTPRSFHELEGYKLELNLKGQLDQLIKEKIVTIVPASKSQPIERFSLTEKGFDSIK